MEGKTINYPREPLIAHKSKRQTGSPGPGAYDISRTFETAPIKIKGRYTKRVFPDEARLVNLPSDFGKVPKIHMGVRSEGIKEKFHVPGPNYMPPSFGAQGRKTSFGSFNDPGKNKARIRPKTALELCETPGPGPGAFNLRDYDHTFDGTGPKGIKMKGKHNFNYDMAYSPGPSAYNPRYNSVLKTAPKPYMHIRPREKPPEPTGAYKDLGSTLTGPAFTIKARNTDDIDLLK